MYSLFIHPFFVNVSSLLVEVSWSEQRFGHVAKVLLLLGLVVFLVFLVVVSRSPASSLPLGFLGLFRFVRLGEMLGRCRRRVRLEVGMFQGAASVRNLNELFGPWASVLKSHAATSTRVARFKESLTEPYKLRTAALRAADKAQAAADGQPTAEGAS